MKNISVPIVQNKKEKNIIETVYDFNDYPYDYIYDNLQLVRKKGKYGCKYANLPMAFDIEASTVEMYREDGTRFGRGHMYHWQFCADKYVIFGRTWEEFIKFMREFIYRLHLRNEVTGEIDYYIVIYVHNLSYEFQFIKDFFEWKEVFAKDAHKVMKAITTNGIEFRCSYFLSNMSLSKFCENSVKCVHYKLIDSYDYKKIRTPYTEITPTEDAYHYNDVRGLCECIESLMLEDNIATIPITNTGFVRRDFRKAMQKNKSNFYNFIKTKLTVAQYSLLRDMFRGGNTHANRLYANTILSDIRSRDLQSSYPAVMMMDYFPTGVFTEVKLDTQEKLNKFTTKYCVIMEIEFFNIREKRSDFVPYIDVAHCIERSNLKSDNGRVIRADYIKYRGVTEIDLDIIRNTYNFDGFKITEAYAASRGKLSKEFRETLMKWYRKKTELKDTGNDYEYMKSKNRVNSAFGMLVQAIVTKEIIYNNGTWEEEDIDLGDAMEKYYNSRSSFLSYQHGVYVTAHARRRLQEGISIVKIDDVYQDTDSVKHRGNYDNEFNELNNKIISECENNDIPAYVDDRGKRWYLGIWDDEGSYLRFKTLGAKKYCYEKLNKKGEKEFTITVAGMNKKKGSEVVGSIENFELGKEYHDVGRTTSWYNDEPIHKITVDGDTFTSASNIGILDTTYTLGVTAQYWDIIKGNPKIIYDY